MVENTRERWGSVQIGLHWTVAALILLVQVPAGLTMVSVQPGDLQNFLYNVHKNVGLIIFLLACFRLAWRWAHPVPFLPPDLPRWQAVTARTTHALLYLLIFLLPTTGFLYNVHKNVGLIIFLLACFRLAWRWAHPVPFLPPDLPGWQAVAARTTHALLYLLLFLLPLTGFLYTALGGFPVPFLMVWDLSKLVPVNKPLGEVFETAHVWLTYLLYATAALHVAGALQHHLVRKDWVLRRMVSSEEPVLAERRASG